MKTQMIKLNLIPGAMPGGLKPAINVSQYDVGRPLKFQLYDGKTKAEIEDDTVITVQGTKPDKTGFAYACTWSGNEVTVATQKQMTVLAGKVECELHLVNGDNEIGTANFVLEVEPGTLTGDTPISNTEVPVIVDAAKSHRIAAEAAQSAAESAKESVEASKAAAATSEANAAESATEAFTSAAEASNSEREAFGSAQSAVAQANAAAQSAAKAQQYAEQALENVTGVSVFTGSDPGLVPRSTKTDAFLRSDGQWADDVATQDYVKNKMSYVGMIIHSTTFDTESKVKEFYGGTTWILHDGYMLRGAASNVLANSASADGGQDTVTPSGTNTGGAVKSHTLTVNEMPSHGHGLPQGGYILTVEAAYPEVTTGVGTGYNWSNQRKQTLSNAGGGQGHIHNFTQPKFTGTQHTNLPQYKNVYIWERTE